MALGYGDLQAIEIAIKTSGQQGLTDLENKVNGVRGQIAAYQAMLAAGAISTSDFIENTRDLIAAEKDLAQAVSAAERVLKGLPASLDSTQRSARGASQALLEVSRAFEDFTVAGPLGALNNMPRIFGGIAQAAGLAAPQVMAVEAASSALATTGYILYRNWDKVRALFADGLDPKVLHDIKEVQDRLKALESLKIKTSVDISDIRNAREELRKLTEQERVYQQLKSGKTESEREVAKLTGQAITEQGGGIDAVERAAANATATPVSDATAKLREKLAEVDRQQAAGNVMAAGTDKAARDAMAKRLAISEANDRANHLRAAGELVRSAAGGDEAARAQLESLVRGNPERFAAAGAAPDFAQALRGSSRSVIEAKQQAEVDREIAKDQKTQEDNAAEVAKRAREAEDRDRKQRTTEGVTAINPAVDDSLQKSLFDAIKGGATPEAAAKGQRAGLLGIVRARNVTEDVAGDVTDALLEKAKAAALALIAEGGKPRIDVRAEQEAKKDETAVEKAEREAKALADKIDRELDQAANRMGKGFLPQAEAELAANRQGILSNRVAEAQGMPTLPVASTPRQAKEFREAGQPFVVPEATLARDLQARAGRDLRATGQDPALAQKLIEKAIRDLDEKLTEAVARTPLPDMSMAGFGDRANQTIARSTQIQSALADVSANLMAGQMQINQRQGQVEARVFGLQRGQAMLKQHKPTVLPMTLGLP